MSAGRFFADPPEDIQEAFGGRTWFEGHGVLVSFRIGIFRGLGWRVPDRVRCDGINGVRIVCIDRAKQLYNVSFVKYAERDPDAYASDPPVIELKTKYCDHVPLAELKTLYEEVLGL